MDAELVARWNATVAADDVVWHLGDFARTAAQADDLLGRLNGTKHLVVGNNDPESVRSLPGWASVQDYAELTEEGVRLVLCHYPFRTWERHGPGRAEPAWAQPRAPGARVSPARCRRGRA